ncbi:MAG: ABC transporter ATP-binding protein [Rickettsiales bacterium]|jgi:lipoprotein-releasing system ATP-binding protein|nr:ABC transporter ATP-binding protein [Rickettsiales bacterium]
MLGAPILELDNVGKIISEGSLGATEILRNSSLKICGGEAVAVAGPSGCGKTTLLQICGLLDEPSAGEVIINGQKTRSLGDVQKTAIRRDSIGFVYQMHHLFPEFTVYENVILPLMVKKERGYRKKVVDLLETLNLGKKINFFPSQLSGGEKQRAAIARAVVANPRLLLADEPTGNLDEQNSINVINLLIGCAKKNNMALMAVSHNWKLIKGFDRIITIDNGRVCPAAQ